jgi:hypothetical protein
MDETRDVAAGSRLHSLGLTISAAGFAVFGVWGALNGDLFFVCFAGAGVGIAGWDLRRTLWSLRLSDGQLELQYVYRRRVIRLEQLRRIRFIPKRSGESGSPPKFAVFLDDGSSFRVAANDETRQLMHSITRRDPSVEVDGTIW